MSSHLDSDDFLDYLDRQFDENIDEITRTAKLVLSGRDAPPEIGQFFDWFSRRSHQAIWGTGNPGYPRWLERLTELSKSLQESAYADDQLAIAARMISRVMDDVSYGATEEGHVALTRDVLAILKNMS